MRSRISPAALFVNVTARMLRALTPSMSTQARDARGEDSRLARPRAGQDEQRTVHGAQASRCAGLRPAVNRSSSIVCISEE